MASKNAGKNLAGTLSVELLRVQQFVLLPAPHPAAVLLDRLWPRGISKTQMAGVVWEKEATPSTALRQWLHVVPQARWDEFQLRFAQELQLPAAQAALARIRAQAQSAEKMLLLTAAKVPERSHLWVLQQELARGA